MIQLSRAHARRIAVRAQLLDGSASGVRETVSRLGFLQLDPTSRVAPSHLLVLWSRLGPYDVGELDRLLWEERTLFEWSAFIYPTEDLPIHRSFMRRFPSGDSAWPRRVRDWLEANAGFRRYVLTELRRHGPLESRELEDRSTQPWPSSGWTGNRNVGQMLEFLWARGEIAVVGRRGGRRLYDLAKRWYPAVKALPVRQADSLWAERRLRSLGIARTGPGLRARVTGVPGEWVVHPTFVDAGQEPLTARTTLLSPFDRLIHDRDRAEALFGFHYRMEIYVPKAERRHGYFVMPVLRSDRLVGRLDPELDRRAGVLRVNAVHWEPGARPVSLERPLRSLATFLGAGTIER